MSWILNSDNIIETDLGWKKLSLLFLAISATLSVFFVQADILIVGSFPENSGSNEGFCFEFSLIALETFINLVVFSVLQVECINRLILIMIGKDRNYSTPEKYGKLGTLSIFYYLVIYLYLVRHIQDYEVGYLVVFKYDSIETDEKIWIAFFILSQVLTLWNTILPIFNEIHFIRTLSLHFLVTSLITFILLSYLPLSFLLFTSTSRTISNILLYPGLLIQAITFIVLITSSILTSLY